jgi:hypothetical protein
MPRDLFADSGQAVAAPAPRDLFAAPQPSQPEQQDSFGENTLDVLGELAAGANRSVTEFIDFLGPDTANAILSLAGSEKRVPTLTGALEPTGIQGGFMKPGAARDVVSAAGSVLPAAAGFAPVVGRNLATAGGAAAEMLGAGTAAVAGPFGAATQAASRIGRELMPVSQAAQDAKVPLLRQSGDVAAAGFKLDDAGNVVKDKAQQLAIQSGVKDGAVAMMSASNKSTKKRIAQMLDIVEGGTKNLKEQSLNRPSKVVGQSIKDRLNVVQRANKTSGQNIDRVAQSLQGKPVEIAPAIDDFMSKLAGEDIYFNPQTGALDFSDSTIEGLPEAQNIIKRVVKRLYDTKDPTRNAYKVHTAKRFIDEQVSYGKTQAGLSGRMEGIIKGLRRGLDGALDSTYPEYDEVNTIYKETRDAIDELQDVAGGKVDLTGDNAEKALGIMSRKLLSNYASGANMEGVFEGLTGIAKRYSSPLDANIDDDLIELVAAEAEIRRLFPESVAVNTFQSQAGGMAMAAGDIATGGKSTLTRKLNEKMGAFLSKDEKQVRDERFRALRELLKQ